MITTKESKLSNESFQQKGYEFISNFTLNKEHINLFQLNDESYQRYLIHATDEYAVLVLVWKESQSTPFHSHPSYGCFFKLYSGSLMDRRLLTGKYHIRENICKPGDIGYIDNEIGIHQIIALKDSISIHVYSPATEAIEKKHIDLRSKYTD